MTDNDKEIEAGINRACECDCGPPSTGWTVNLFPIIRDYIERLKRRAEVAEKECVELRARLEKAVELPLVQTIRGNKLPYEVAYKDGNGRIIVTKYRRWQKKQAEARLKEMQGGER